MPTERCCVKQLGKYTQFLVRGMILHMSFDAWPVLENILVKLLQIFGLPTPCILPLTSRLREGFLVPYLCRDQAERGFENSENFIFSPNRQGYMLISTKYC